MINNENNQEDCQLNFFRRVLKRLIAPWAWNFEDERIPADKFPDLSLLIQIGSNRHWIINGVDTGIIAEGRRGLSAYEIAVALGFNGTEAEWLESLKGERGDRGLLGVRGPIGITGETGEQGIRGLKGDTPTIKNGMWYISGINTGVKAEGQDGRDGRDGVDGLNGADGVDGAPGTSTYFHVAYANKIGGTIVNFSTSDPTNREYIGTYIDGNLSDSSNPSNYKWQLVKGADGEQGIPGTNGEDGRTLYLHIKYSNDKRTFTPNNGEDPGIYLGLCVDFNVSDPSNFNDYKWALIKGSDGIDAVLNEQLLELLNTVSSDLGEVNSKLGEIATYDSNNNITGITQYLATKIEDTIAGLATLSTVSTGGGHNILQTLFAQIGDGPDSPMASLILAVNETGASISGIAQLGEFIGSISAKADASGVLTALQAVADSNGEVTVASITAAINGGSSLIKAKASNFVIVNSSDLTTFSIDSNGNITASGNATFTGGIVATSLTLQGITIPQSNINGLTTALSNKANDSDVLKKEVTLGTLPTSGATTSSSTGFQVDLNGLLTASNAVIYGTVYATNGSFSGSVTSTNGTIGGWSINNSSLSCGRTVAATGGEAGIILDKNNVTITAMYLEGPVNSISLTYLQISPDGWYTYESNRASGNITNKVNTDGSGFLACSNITWNTSGEGTLAGWSFDSTKLSKSVQTTESTNTYNNYIEINSSTSEISIYRRLLSATPLDFYYAEMSGRGFCTHTKNSSQTTDTITNIIYSNGKFNLAEGVIVWNGTDLKFLNLAPIFEGGLNITDSSAVASCPETGLLFNCGYICASGTFNSTTDEGMYFESVSGQYHFENGGAASSTLYAGNFSQTSDIRLKENILDFFISAETLAQMPSVLFNFKSNKDIRQAGTIAQDWLEVLPEVVRENRDGTLSMNYANASMVSVISMAKEIVKLKEEIKELKANL